MGAILDNAVGGDDRLKELEAEKETLDLRVEELKILAARDIGSGDFDERAKAEVLETLRGLVAKSGIVTGEMIQILERQRRELNDRHERAMEAGRIIFGRVGVAGDRRRQDLVDNLRRLTHVKMTPAEHLRAWATRGRGLIERYGAPEESMSSYLERAAAFLPAEWKSVGDIALRNLHLIARWAWFGFNEISLSRDLSVGLVLTEAPEDLEVLRLPFPAFVISVPEGVVPFFVPDGDTSRQQWADTIWVHELETEPGAVVLEISVCWRGLAVMRHLPREIAGLDPEEVTPPEERSFLPEDEHILDVAWRYLRNFLLWLEAMGGMRSHRPEVVPPKLAEKRQRRGEAWPKSWVMGREVVLGSELRRAAAEFVLGRSQRHAVPGWHLRHRFVVRGHWRNQACGFQRTLRRRRWIQPFWKGPQGTEAWSHIYTNQSTAKGDR